MASTTNKDITLPTYNDYAADATGWTDPVNFNWRRIDAALGAIQTINLGGAGAITVTLTNIFPPVVYPSGGNASYIPLILNITGAMTGNCIVRVPSGVSGQWIVNNGSTGAFTVTVDSGGGGTSVPCQQGYVTSIYSDGTNILKTNTVPIANNSVTNAMLATIATQRIKGRATAGTGDVEDLTASQVLDFLSSTQGAVLYRGASAWQALAVGTSGQLLTTNGAGFDPSWTTPASALPTQTGNSGGLLTTDGSTPSWSRDSTVRARGTLNTAGNTWDTGVINFSSSVTNTTGGTFDFSFSTALASANYQVVFTSGVNSGFTSGAGGAIANKTTTGFRLYTYNTATGGALEPVSFDLVVYGGF